MDFSVWGAGEQQKIDVLITELLKPACGVDAVEHADDYCFLLLGQVHVVSLLPFHQIFATRHKAKSEIESQLDDQVPKIIT